MNLGTQIAKIWLYWNCDGSKLTQPDFGRHLEDLRVLEEDFLELLIS